MTDAADTPDAADATDPPATVAGAVRAVRGRLAAAVLLQAAASASGLVAVVAVAEIGRAAVADPGGPPAWGGVVLAAVAGIAGLLLAASADTLTHLADADLQLDLRRLVVARLAWSRSPGSTTTTPARCARPCSRTWRRCTRSSRTRSSTSRGSSS